jgi:hypothetical protein
MDCIRGSNHSQTQLVRRKGPDKIRTAIWDEPSILGGIEMHVINANVSMSEEWKYSCVEP